MGWVINAKLRSLYSPEKYPGAIERENYPLHHRSSSPDRSALSGLISRQTIIIKSTFSPHVATAPSESGPPHYRGFTITLGHTTLGRTPLGEWSARRRDLYLTTHNTHKKTDISAAGSIRIYKPRKRAAADLGSQRITQTKLTYFLGICQNFIQAYVSI